MLRLNRVFVATVVLGSTAMALHSEVITIEGTVRSVDAKKRIAFTRRPI
jgi:hypothetical protein